MLNQLTIEFDEIFLLLLSIQPLLFGKFQLDSIYWCQFLNSSIIIIQNHKIKSKSIQSILQREFFQLLIFRQLKNSCATDFQVVQIILGLVVDKYSNSAQIYCLVHFIFYSYFSLLFFVCQLFLINVFLLYQLSLMRNVKKINQFVIESTFCIVAISVGLFVCLFCCLFVVFILFISNRHTPFIYLLNNYLVWQVC
eukprot:TRINITY_DN3480_c0_g2_i1.p3 TRINITY_DN3480_c0_g2~~TRINITY_DN3480_c0_g2_i1.p3  ORF type:complete len:196 (-),score=-8.49 TRINITY_DN3480_c0_g2_i1:493-1080(-)